MQHAENLVNEFCKENDIEVNSTMNYKLLSLAYKIYSEGYQQAMEKASEMIFKTK